MSWDIESINGSTVIVSDDQPLPFFLEDDDQTQYPFDPSRCLMSDAQSEPPSGCSAPSFPPGPWWWYNGYAQAYIRPRFVEMPQSCFGQGGPKTPPFNRNVSCPGPTPQTCNGAEFYAQIALGRDICPTTAGYWASYVQSAFQEDEVHGDLDPSAELESPLGESPKNDLSGAMLYLEQVHDNMVQNHLPEFEARCSARVLVHELGHQFGLDHSADGFMQPGACAYDTDYFLTTELAKIRQKGLP